MAWQQFAERIHRCLHGVQLGVLRAHQVPLLLLVHCFEFQYKAHVLHDFQCAVGIDQGGLHFGVVHAKAAVLGLRCRDDVDDVGFELINHIIAAHLAGRQCWQEP